MIEIRKTDVFSKGFDGLKDRLGKARIQARIDRLELGHFGDTSTVGEGIGELRIFCSPGYRVYYVKRGEVCVVLLSGGDKGTQNSDIVKAKKLARQPED